MCGICVWYMCGVYVWGICVYGSCTWGGGQREDTECLPLSLSAHLSGWAGQPANGLCSAMLELQAQEAVPGFLHGCWDLNSVSPACTATASTLTQ